MYSILVTSDLRMLLACQPILHQSDSVDVPSSRRDAGQRWLRLASRRPGARGPYSRTYSRRAALQLTTTMAADTQPAEGAKGSTPPAKQPQYDGSTQFRHWRFSVEQLASMRASLNSAAVAVIRNAFEADSAG